MIDSGCTLKRWWEEAIPWYDKRLWHATIGPGTGERQAVQAEEALLIGSVIGESEREVTEK